MFVSGGVGFAGIVSYVLDLLHALERSVLHEQITVKVVCVVAEVEHLEGYAYWCCLDASNHLCVHSTYFVRIEITLKSKPLFLPSQMDVSCLQLKIIWN